MEQAGYYRYPSISRDQVVFVSEDDLWSVNIQGGIPRRLTAGFGSASRPWISPDGRHIAFVGREEGDTEIYVMPAQGGPARRLTYFGATSTVAGWTVDGKILFSTNYQSPFRNWNTIYTVSLAGDVPRALPFGPANSIAFGPHGTSVIGRNTGDLARWKRYLGGTRGVLWIDAAGSGTFTRFDKIAGNISHPMWIDQRIYFVSDYEGIANLYSMTPQGNDIQRLTHHQGFYVRHATTDGRTIVYQGGGDLYAYSPDTQQSTKIAIDYGSQKTQLETTYVNAAQYWTETALSPDNASMIVTSRGKIFAMGDFEGAVEQLGTPDGVRYRLTTFLPDGEHVLTISDESGEETLQILPLNSSEPKTEFAHGIGRALYLKVSPDGQFAALANHRYELWLVDLKAYSAHIIDQSKYGAISGVNWSPDSQWIAYGYHASSKTSIIKLYNLASAESYDITQPILMDSMPIFDPQGRYLYFLSNRTFNPVYDNMKFDLAFPNGMKPYLIPLSKDTPSPFIPAPHPFIEPQPANDAADTAPKALPTIDLDGIQNRILEFPVSEGRYVQLLAHDNLVFWTTMAPEGSLNNSWYPSEPPAKATLHSFNLTTLKQEKIMEQVTSVDLSPDRAVMAIRSKNSLQLVKTGTKPEKDRKKPGRESGIINFGRITVPINRQAEWTQMLREAWRLMRDNFWTETMSEVNWSAIFEQYLNLLPRLSTRSEFSDLIWEMQGELGTSHAYEMGGDYRDEPNNRIGLLGADFIWNPQQNGYTITHIVTGDSWNPHATSPLLSPGTHIKPGNTIITINGQPLSEYIPPSSRLINQAGRDVKLQIQDENSQNRFVTIRPLDSEMPARYRQWVENNRQIVSQATNQRVGYVHIPDMGPRGFAEFYRSYLRESQKEGLIVDVRFNGGGHVSQLILEKLARTRLGYDLPRHGMPEPYPGDTVAGPIVGITNENAGSDGDIFSHAFKMLKLGPLIGQRTWGGVIGIWARHALVDGSITTQPEFSFWFFDVGWGVENYGTDPTIVVDNTPMDYRDHFDAQLDRAIAETLNKLETSPPPKPDFSRRPSRRIPQLDE